MRRRMMKPLAMIAVVAGLMAVPMMAQATTMNPGERAGAVQNKYHRHYSHPVEVRPEVERKPYWTYRHVDQHQFNIHHGHGVLKDKLERHNGRYVQYFHR